MGVLGHVRMVLWSFFGIRRQVAAGEEFAQVHPLGLVAVAVGVAALFGLGLWALAKVAVRTLGA